MAGRIGRGPDEVMPKALLDTGESMGSGSSVFKGERESMAGSLWLVTQSRAEQREEKDVKSQVTALEMSERTSLDRPGERQIGGGW